MKKTAQHLTAEVPCRRSRVETTIGIDLGDIWSHYCTLCTIGAVQPPGWKTFWWLTASPSPRFRLPKTIVETMVNTPSATSAL